MARIVFATDNQSLMPLCADRMAGRTPDAIAQDIHSTLGSKGISFADVTSMVSAAESNYCPD